MVLEKESIGSRGSILGLMAVLTSVCGITALFSLIILIISGSDASQAIGLFLLWSPPLFAITGMVLARKADSSSDLLRKIGWWAGILCLTLWATFMIVMMSQMVVTF